MQGGQTDADSGLSWVKAPWSKRAIRNGALLRERTTSGQTQGQMWLHFPIVIQDYKNGSEKSRERGLRRTTRLHQKPE